MTAAVAGAAPGAKERARDLGVPFDGTPGALNAITDVKGVEVGYATRIEGDGKLVVGKGPVRTGVTVILPRGRNDASPVYAGWFSQNGNGEMTGTTWIEEAGQLEGPVAITNTHSVGLVRDSIIGWNVDAGRLTEQPWMLPVVAETWDGALNDINGFHVTKEDVYAALNSAKGGSIAEGSVGGGTGMICYQFKGGSGTSSRVIDKKYGGYTVGVFVQCNCGSRSELRVAGVRVGLAIPGHVEDLAALHRQADEDLGSIIIVVATDAPLLPGQLKRLARRATMGLARTGSTSGNGSGDIFVAFSTANRGADNPPGPNPVQTVSNSNISALFGATVQATEEAIINAMVAAPTMKGINGTTIEGIPHEKVRGLMKTARDAGLPGTGK
jgi:D-aminopeptidase